MSKILPLKRFGQNYLQDQNIIRKIISEIDPKEKDVIIEIGPGQGALTQHLVKLKSTTNFWAIAESDRAALLSTSRYE